MNVACGFHPVCDPPRGGLCPLASALSFSMPCMVGFLSCLVRAVGLYNVVLYTNDTVSPSLYRTMPCKTLLPLSLRNARPVDSDTLYHGLYYLVDESILVASIACCEIVVLHCDD